MIESQTVLGDAEREDILDSVREHELSSDVEAVIETYESNVGDRDGFLWKWVHSVLAPIQLSSVDTRPTAVTDTKTIITLLVSLYDDLLEKHGDLESFDRAFSIPFRFENAEIDDAAGLNREYLECIDDVWTEIDSRLIEAPRHDEFRRILEYDFRQVLDAIEYSSIVSDTPGLANMNESRIHEAHNMTMFVYADVDLMYSRGFDSRELGLLRRAIWHGQQMARIGNWLSTWERELREGDYSSGVIIRSLEENVIGAEELDRLDGADDERLDQIRDAIRDGEAEEYLFELWERQRLELETLEGEIESVDLERFLSGLELVFKFHLASRGLK